MLTLRKAAPKKARVALREILLLAVPLVIFGAFAGRAAAQGRPAPALGPAKGDEILMLGTHGGPGLEKDRSEPASVLIVDGRPYLIDCGIGTMRRLLDAGVPSAMIGTIFITHNHPDHALGLVDVMANDFLSVDFGPRNRARTFNIYGPPQTPALVQAAYNFIRIPYGIFAAENLGASTLVDPFRAHAIDRNGLVYQDDKIRVTAVENTHYQLMAEKYHATMKSYSYRFQTPSGVIVFTGDTGPSDAVEKLATGADVLVSEVISAPGIPAGREVTPNQSALAAHMREEHLPVEDLGKMAAKAQVKAVVMHHFVGPGSGEQFVEGVKKYYSGPVYASEDLQRYCLGTPDGRGGTVHVLAPCH
jgi:ribonuclease BN (tRNA processing enzyme)